MVDLDSPFPSDFMVCSCHSNPCHSARSHCRNDSVGIDDNLTVPLAAGLFMLALHQIDPLTSPEEGDFAPSIFDGSHNQSDPRRTIFFLKMVSLSGFVSGFLIGTILYTFGGYQLFLILFLFFFLGSGSTKFGYAYKKSLGIAQEKGGARGWKNAVANCSVGFFFLFLPCFLRIHFLPSLLQESLEPLQLLLQIQ